jgi:hypothetical protein
VQTFLCPHGKASMTTEAAVHAAESPRRTLSITLCFRDECRKEPILFTVRFATNIATEHLTRPRTSTNRKLLVK